jgi:hypothetical protein
MQNNQTTIKQLEDNRIAVVSGELAKYDTEPTLEQIEDTQLASKAESTNLTYKGSMNRQKLYFKSQGWITKPKDKAKPEDTDEWQEFAAHVRWYMQKKVNEGCGFNSINLIFCANKDYVAYKSMAANYWINRPELKAFVQGVRRQGKSKSSRKSEPLTRQQIELINRYFASQPKTLKNLRDHSILCGHGTASRGQDYGNFRLGDLTEASSVNGLTFHLRYSKTDQVGAGRDITVLQSPDPAVDNVRVHRAFLAKLEQVTGLNGKNSPDSALYPEIKGDNSPQYETVNGIQRLKPVKNSAAMGTRILRRVLLASGAATADQLWRYTIHSLRHTFADLSDKAGVPLERIMKTTGHKDARTAMGYIHTSSEAAAQVDYLK